MMQRWHKRKAKLPLITLIFSVCIVLVVLYNEGNIQRIYQKQDHFDNEFSLRQGPFVKFTPLWNYPYLNKILVALDKRSFCNVTVKYRGRRDQWAVEAAEPIGRRELEEEEEEEVCDLFLGKWVFDNTSYPLYNESDCPYMSDQLACHKHGRQDLRYQYWRWQPHGCNLKRWNVTEMWEKLRGKRLMFVGDSLNRGQWISMVCLLQSVIPAEKRSMSPNAQLTIFRAEEYDATVEFLWAPLLVESNSDDPVDHRLSKRILRPDSIHRHASQWEHADILVFNSYLWWRQGPVKLQWSTAADGFCEETNGLGGMELAMGAWANWVASNVDPQNKKVFFVTMSPTHFSKEEWEPGSKGNCYDEKIPIFHNESYWGRDSDMPTMQMVRKVLSRLSSKVITLNITQLSEYRKDGHPTVFRKFWETLTPERLSDPESYSDCIHWCLPGVPDVWNELLFQFL